ncbi:MAG TPA: alpha/beta fold hydrolase, partial [Solirubrobacteraceae bacterium]|nr:alpha/beta fold hydrolase [Solirubrobacteraceae bacterium]
MLASLVALAGALQAAISASTAYSATSSRLSFVPCADTEAFQCATLAVPLDRRGTLPGAVPLSVERKASGSGATASAVLTLAGGPGQAALPHAEDIAKLIAPALQGRDLLVFDQRGTGASDPLSCSAFEEPLSSEAVAAENCALDIGPARGDFTTVESVSDIEALRQAAGYEKLVLYGTSYGTKVALEYAERFPSHVEALVLDSVVPSDGEEPLHEASFQAMTPVLEELCGGGACAGITANPVADLAALNAQLRHRSLHGNVFDGSGRRHRASLGELGVYDILIAGDLNPALRALLPAAVHSALHHEPDPLLRLNRLSEGLIPNIPLAQPPAASAGDIDEALYATTICEETPFPWQRGATAHTREAEALAFLHGQPASAFYPFDAATAYEGSSMPACSRWPDASAAPPAAGALPDVPTLIFSGAQDLRTPTSQAVRVAASIPAAHVVVVPFTGHSVIGSDLGRCAQNALTAFFGNAPVNPCEPESDLFAPTAATPTSLAFVHAPPGVGGRAGRTLGA